MTKKKNENTVRTTITLSKNTVKVLEALAEIGFRGNYYTEVATALLEQRVEELADSDVIQKRLKTLKDAQDLIDSNKKKTD